MIAIPYVYMGVQGSARFGRIAIRHIMRDRLIDTIGGLYLRRRDRTPLKFARGKSEMIHHKQKYLTCEYLHHRRGSSHMKIKSERHCSSVEDGLDSTRCCNES